MVSSDDLVEQVQQVQQLELRCSVQPQLLVAEPDFASITPGFVLFFRVTYAHIMNVETVTAWSPA
jgi:hypothetical protein